MNTKVPKTLAVSQLVKNLTFIEIPYTVLICLTLSTKHRLDKFTIKHKSNKIQKHMVSERW